MSPKSSGRSIPAVLPEIGPVPSGLLDERAEDFLRAAAAWIWETDEQLRLSEFGRAATADLGVPTQLLLGRPLPQLAAADEESAAVLSLLRRRQPFRNRTLRLRRPNDGSEVALVLSGVPFFDPLDGRFAGYRGTGGPAAAAPIALGRSRRAEVAETLANEVERLSAEVCDLRLALQRLGTETPQGSGDDAQEMARLGHELRSPLNAILGYAEFAQQRPYGPLPLRYQDCMERIAAAARHLQRVVDALGSDHQGDLAAAMEAANEGGEERENCRLDQAVSEALSIVSIEAERRSVDCSAVPVPLPLRVPVPHGALVQILVNLLGNAVKFSPESGAVGLEVETEGTERLQLVVWDQGDGIPAALLGRIFEAGFRADNHARGGPDGKGLGLAIARDLARRFGGEIKAENSPRRGARLRLTLPLAESGQEPASACDNGD